MAVAASKQQTVRGLPAVHPDVAKTLAFKTLAVL
jgi:hypothetical protein